MGEARRGQSWDGVGTEACRSQEEVPDSTWEEVRQSFLSIGKRQGTVFQAEGAACAKVSILFSIKLTLECGLPPLAVSGLEAGNSIVS